jgi:hypothetical protein
MSVGVQNRLHHDTSLAPTAVQTPKPFQNPNQSTNTNNTAPLQNYDHCIDLWRRPEDQDSPYLPLWLNSVVPVSIAGEGWWTTTPSPFLRGSSSTVASLQQNRLASTSTSPHRENTSRLVPRALRKTQRRGGGGSCQGCLECASFLFWRSIDALLFVSDVRRLARYGVPVGHGVGSDIQTMYVCSVGCPMGQVTRENKDKKQSNKIYD